MPPIRRTAHAMSTVTPSIELTTIQNALQLTQLTISRIRTNSKLAFSNADLDALSSIRNNVFTIQQEVTQFSRSIGKRNTNQPQSTMPRHSATPTNSSSNNTSPTRIVTPRRTLINKIYNRPATKPPKKNICWYHLRHWHNCDGSCGFVSTLPTDKQKSSLSQIQKNKENIVPTAAVKKSIIDPAPTVSQTISPPTAAVVQSIPDQTNGPPVNWSDICEAEETRLLADNPDPVNDVLSQAMLRAELQAELNSVSD